MRASGGLYRRWEPALVDRWLNIRTCGAVQAPYAETGPDPAEFHFKPFLFNWLIRRSISFRPDDVFVDVGCGTGRMRLLVARRRIRRCVGVEFRAGLASVCQQNARTIRGRKCPIEVRHENALDSDCSEGTIFYLFHPFDDRAILSGVLARIRVGLERHPRKIQLVYVNPVFHDCFDQEPWIRYKETKSYPLTPLTARFYEAGDE